MLLLRRLFVATLSLAVTARAFTPTSRHNTNKRVSTSTTSSSTRLAALPPMIIGPFLKKMKDEKAAKKAPMADAAQVATEAPGLRVGQGAWKWPRMWPYDTDFFVTSKSYDSAQQKKQLNQVASALNGIAQVPTAENNNGMMLGGSPGAGAAVDENDDDEDTWDSLTYWSSDAQGAVPTVMDPEAVANLKEHYAYYLKDGMSILELGAAEESYLPANLTVSRHVGVGASPAMMKKNPSLTETLVVDLNKAVEGRDVDNDDFRRLAEAPFDAVLMANTVDFLTSPREVVRSAWYLLKPGGVMMIPFSGKEGTKDQFADAKTKMWNDFNDDQHLWMTGSFFHFSAGDGWESLLGFDISPESAKEKAEGPMAILDRGKNNHIYVVQAIKGFQDDKIDPENLERSIQSLTWMLPGMEQRDKDLVVPRLARAYETVENTAVRSAIARNIPKLPAVYQALSKMDQYAFTFNMQAQLATDLVCDPDFGGTEEELLALREGLGLRTPTPEFWEPMGELTGAMPIEEKISLLGHIVPCFGSDDPEQEAALQDFVLGLKPTCAVVRAKCPDLEEADVQLLGAELLAYEILKPGRSSKIDFSTWMATLTGEELLEMLSARKSYRVTAKHLLEEYKEEQAETEAKRQEYLDNMEEQKKKASLARSMVFNPRTEKFEVFDNPNKEEKKGFFGFGA